MKPASGGVYPRRTPGSTRWLAINGRRLAMAKLHTRHPKDIPMVKSTNGSPANIGRVTQVIGSTFDAEFSEENLPEIYNALRIESTVKGVKLKLTGEVQQHLGGGRVRCVALGSTDGVVRGMEVVDLGGPVSVP